MYFLSPLKTALEIHQMRPSSALSAHPTQSLIPHAQPVLIAGANTRYEVVNSRAAKSSSLLAREKGTVKTQELRKGHFITFAHYDRLV